jgi:hypothetical protein
VRDPAWRDWRPDLSPPKVRALLETGEEQEVCLRGVPNPRVTPAAAAAALLRDPAPDATVEQARAELPRPATGGGIDPDAWWALEAAGFQVEISWAAGTEDGRYDVAVRNSVDVLGKVKWPNNAASAADFADLARDPMCAAPLVDAVPVLKDHLRSILPDYMLPGAFVLVDQIPLTPNGKIDRTALQARQHSVEDGRDYVTPVTATEKVLTGILAQVLHRERVGVTDNFFEVGGHSLLATQVVSRVRQEFQLDVSLRLLFEAPTAEALAKRIDALRGGAGISRPPLLPRAAGLDKVPLSFAQQRLWFLDQLEPGSATYNMPAALRIEGQLDLGILQRAFTEIVRRHQILRTSFAEVGGEPVQVIHPPFAVALPAEDLTAMPTSEQDTVIAQIAAAEAGHPFDLAQGPLLRVRVLQASATSHVVLVTMHHIVSDGWSMSIFIQEIRDLYEAYSSGRASPLPELPVQYADFALWQKEWLSGEVLDEQLSYWRARLAGMSGMLELPTDRPRPSVPSFRGALRNFQLDLHHLERLRAICRREGVTLYMVLLAALQAVLGRWSGQADVAVGSPIAGRNDERIERLIGFFTNTLVLRTDLSGDPSFAELLQRVREVALGGFTHQDVPFEQLVAELQPRRDLSRSRSSR